MVWRITPQLARGVQVNPLHINGRNFAAVLQLNDPIACLIAANGFVGVHRLRNFQLRRFSALDQIQNERSSPKLHHSGPFAHVGIAEDDVKAAVTAGVHMRLVACIDQRTAIHRVDAHHHAEKISAL